jgi:hypothetical protein
MAEVDRYTALHKINEDELRVSFDSILIIEKELRIGWPESR